MIGGASLDRGRGLRAAGGWVTAAASRVTRRPTWRAGAVCRSRRVAAARAACRLPTRHVGFCSSCWWGTRADHVAAGGLPAVALRARQGRVRSDGGRPAAARRPPDTFGHLPCPRVASIRRGGGSASLGESPARPPTSSATLLSALGAACRSSECHRDDAGAGQAQRHRRRAGEPSPAHAGHPGQCERHQLGADLHPPHPPQYQRHSSRLPRRVEAQPTPPSCPQPSLYLRGWFDGGQTRHPPPHRHIAPHPTHTRLSLALPETLPQIEPEPPTSEETRCR